MIHSQNKNKLNPQTETDWTTKDRLAVDVNPTEMADRKHNKIMQRLWQAITAGKAIILSSILSGVGDDDKFGVDLYSLCRGFLNVVLYCGGGGGPKLTF